MGDAAMPGPLVPDELWETIQPLLPRHKAKPGKRGRPPVDDRACLTGIVFVLKTGPPRGGSPLGDGLWFRGDLLAPPAVLAAPRRLEETAARAAGSLGPRGPDRLG